jgi:hypothetical protein
LHPEVYYISFLTSLYAEITLNYLEYFTYPALQERGIVKISKNISLSAGNNKKIGTSETIRDESLKSISIHVPKHLKSLSSNELGYYLAGLIDGDGHFSKNQLIIAFNIQDIALAYFLKKQIEFGNVYKVKNKNAVILVVANKIGLLKIINLINGKIRNPSKLNQINNLIKNFSITHPTAGEGVFILDTSTNFKNH